PPRRHPRGARGRDRRGAGVDQGAARVAGRRQRAARRVGSRRRRARLALMAPLIERFRDRLPVTAATPVVSLGEGSTPLLRAPRLSERLGAELWLKWEGANPTGSFKDRGMTVAASKALEEGATALVCASTGNTAASAAAYGARAGLAVVIVHPAGAVAAAKLAQARAVGARIAEVE